jgi:hypothetical protein
MRHRIARSVSRSVHVAGLERRRVLCQLHGAWDEATGKFTVNEHVSTVLPLHPGWKPPPPDHGAEALKGERRRGADVAGASAAQSRCRCGRGERSRGAALADEWWKRKPTFSSLIAHLPTDHDSTVSPQELEHALAQLLNVQDPAAFAPLLLAREPWLGSSISPDVLRWAVRGFNQNHNGRIARHDVVREIMSRKPKDDELVRLPLPRPHLPGP